MVKQNKSRFFENLLVITLVIFSISVVYVEITKKKSIDTAYDNIPEIKEVLHEPSGIINNNGVDVNVDQLKQDYGLAYFLYEPLTDEQINEQFKIILKYSIEMRIKGEEFDDAIGVTDQFGFFRIWQYDYDVYKPFQNDYFNLRTFLLNYTNFSKYFNAGKPIVEQTEGFIFYSPELDEYESKFLEGSKDFSDIDTISMEQKEIYVRYWKYHMFSIIEQIKKQGLVEIYRTYNPDLFQ